MRQVETLIHARWVIPVAPDDRVLDRHSVAVDDGRIVAVVPTREARSSLSAATEIELHEHALIPGLVNAHTHAAMSLFRGLADDLPLNRWLNEHIWPAEQKWVSTEFVADGSRLAIAEMLTGGTTCFNDMYFFPDVVARVAEQAGIRACVGLILIDFPTAWAADAEQYLEKGLALHDRLRHSPLLHTAFAPHAPYTVSDGPLEKIRVLADELAIPVHIHVHETAHEVDEAVTRYGIRPLERLSQLGLLSPRLIAVHMTQLLSEEIQALALAGASVVHCPESNLKLASGFAPVAELVKAGVNVALGTDGAASNNDLDILAEMRTAALLAKGVSQDPTAVPAHEALRMATLNGARALGLDQVTGSIEIGKSADLAAIDLSHLATQPVFDPVSQIVYSAGRNQVSDVFVAGRRLVDSYRLTTIDTAELHSTASRWSKRLAQF